MKAISTLTLFAVVAALITPNAVQAGDKERAIIGGLIGGIVIGAVLADDHHDTHVSVRYNSRSHQGHHDSHGYWNWVSVKRWVPGYYERSCDRHGHPRRVWISGHYTWVKEKVWVSSHHGNPHGRPDYNYRHDDRRHDRYDHSGDDRHNSRYDKSHDDGRRDRSSQVVRRF